MAMKSNLVLLLLLSAVVASHANQVSCKNTCKDTIWLNGIEVRKGAVVILDLKLKLEITVVVIGTEGGKHSGTYKCPKDVKQLEFGYNKGSGFLEVYITGVLHILGELLHSLLGKKSNLIQCNMHY